MAKNVGTPNSDTRAGNVSKFIVHQAGDGAGKVNIDLSPACVEFKYYESILSNSISASAVIVEAGLTDTALGSMSVLDGLPIRGGEQIDLVIEDNQSRPNSLHFTPKTGSELYVNRIRNVEPGTQKNIYFMDICTREFITNEQTRVVKRYDGNIGESVERILTKPLGGKKSPKLTEKRLDVDKTATSYNFIGNDKKPFYVCTWLASKSAPDLSVDGKNSKGGAAGYFFYETANPPDSDGRGKGSGFNFRSIDMMFDYKTPFKGTRYIYTNTPDQGAEYSGKILSVTIDRDADLQEKLATGAYANRSIFFDYYSMDYRIRDYNLENQKDKVRTGGKESVAQGINPSISQPPTRLMSHISDVGTLPSGEDAEAQLKEWKANPRGPGYDVDNLMVQSIMRYNQLFSIKLNVMIGGNFSLRAGQLIHCEFPEMTVHKRKDPNTELGGIYMIASLCHRITPEDTYTSLTLVRDTFGRTSFTTK